MGYNTYVHGGWRIEPPLSDKACEYLQLREHDDGEFRASVHGTPDDVGLVNGEIKVIPGHQYMFIEPRMDEPYKAYDTGETLDKIAETIRKAGCTGLGSIYLFGEEHNDTSRYRLNQTTLVHERPKLVWPNGDEEQL